MNVKWCWCGAEERQHQQPLRQQSVTGTYLAVATVTTHGNRRGTIFAQRPPRTAQRPSPTGVNRRSPSRLRGQYPSRRRRPAGHRPACEGTGDQTASNLHATHLSSARAQSNKNRSTTKCWWIWPSNARRRVRCRPATRHARRLTPPTAPLCDDGLLSGIDTITMKVCGGACRPPSRAINTLVLSPEILKRGATKNRRWELGRVRQPAALRVKWQ